MVQRPTIYFLCGAGKQGNITQLLRHIFHEFYVSSDSARD